MYLHVSFLKWAEGGGNRTSHPPKIPSNSENGGWYAHGLWTAKELGEILDLLSKDATSSPLQKSIKEFKDEAN